MIGLDTAFLIDFFNKDEAAKHVWESEQAFCICESTVFEFLCGNLTGDEQDIFLDFTRQLPSMNLDTAASQKAAEIYRTAKRTGKSIGPLDALIAGTYLANGVKKIATRNTKHFADVADLEVIAY